MKHTDFFSMADAILSLEYKELYAAIKAHGGSYKWDVDNDEDYPIIAVNVDSIAPNPCDVKVRCVKITSKDTIKIYGEEKEYGGDVDFEWSNVFTGHLSSIIDYIPEINDIYDVSEKHVVKILFGTEACKAYSNGENIDYFEDEVGGYDYKEVSFSTDKEKDAYVQGLIDIDGWGDYLILDHNNIFEDESK